jgi:hypothetical protein
VSVLLALLMVFVMSDGFPNDDDEPVLYSANRVVGDIAPQGADHPAQRLVDTTVGAGLFTTNSDPSVVSVDPLTGEDAPVGTDVGFGAAVRRYIQTGVLNGDFSIPPPDITQAISDSNPLPYWTWTPPGDGLTIASISADATYASGYRLDVTYGTGATGVGTMDQLVAVPMSQGQQYRVLLSVFPGTSNLIALRYQYLALDAATTIGSEVEGTTSAGRELKIDAGLVPTTAAYIRVRIYIDTSLYVKPGGSIIGEVRAAFLPAEATLGLGSITANSGNIDTGETVVKAVTVPADTFVVGSVYRITAWATVTSTVNNAVTVRLRIGPTTLVGTIVESLNPTANTTASDDGVVYHAMFTVRSVGVSGSVIGAISFTASETEPFGVGYRTDVATAAVTIDTTVANLVELTAVTAGGNTDINFRQAVIECVMAS